MPLTNNPSILGIDKIPISVSDIDSALEGTNFDIIRSNDKITKHILSQQTVLEKAIDSEDWATVIRIGKELMIMIDTTIDEINKLEDSGFSNKLGSMLVGLTKAKVGLTNVFRKTGNRLKMVDAVGEKAITGNQYKANILRSLKEVRYVIYEMVNLAHDKSGSAFEATGYVSALEAKLTKEEKDSLPDSVFGLPKERKYPLHDKQHVVAAVHYWKYCDENKQRELSKNILKKAKEFGVTINKAEIWEKSGIPYKYTISPESSKPKFYFLSDAPSNALRGPLAKKHINANESVEEPASETYSSYIPDMNLPSDVKYGGCSKQLAILEENVMLKFKPYLIKEKLAYGDEKKILSICEYFLNDLDGIIKTVREMPDDSPEEVSLDKIAIQKTRIKNSKNGIVIPCAIASLFAIVGKREKAGRNALIGGALGVFVSAGVLSYQVFNFTEFDKVVSKYGIDPNYSIGRKKLIISLFRDREFFTKLTDELRRTSSTTAIETWETALEGLNGITYPTDEKYKEFKLACENNRKEFDQKIDLLNKKLHPDGTDNTRVRSPQSYYDHIKSQMCAVIYDELRFIDKQFNRIMSVTDTKEEIEKDNQLYLKANVGKQIGRTAASSVAAAAIGTGVGFGTARKKDTYKVEYDAEIGGDVVEFDKKKNTVQNTLMGAGIGLGVGAGAGLVAMFKERNDIKKCKYSGGKYSALANLLTYAVHVFEPIGKQKTTESYMEPSIKLYTKIVKKLQSI